MLVRYALRSFLRVPAKPFGTRPLQECSGDALVQESEKMDTYNSARVPMHRRAPLHTDTSQDVDAHKMECHKTHKISAQTQWSE